MIVVCICGEVSNRHHVLVVEQVQGPDPTENFIDEGVVHCAIQLKHVHGHAEHSESDDKDDHEERDVFDGLIDESNVYGGRLEELAPF